MKILIIEDEAAIAAFITKGLAKESFLTETASDGEMGAIMAKSGGYGLIILDQGLPKISGLEVLQDIRKNGINAPVIMLTVLSELNDKELAFTAGADDYLTKPFLLEELLLRVRALLRRPASISAETEKLGNIFFDTYRASFRRGRKDLYLTRQEYCLLKYLWRKQGEIVSRGEILEHVWRYQSDPFSNSLQTHIASLRKKIDGGSRPGLIHTFPGRGYKLALKKLD